MANLSGLKNEISFTQDIGVITNAMQLVATAKLQKMGKKVQETQEYLQEVYAIFNDIILQINDSPFLKKADQEIKKTLWVVVNSSLGLCGAYNINVNKLVLSQLKRNDQVYAIGSKAISFYTSRKIKIVKSQADFGNDFTSEKASEMGKELLEAFISNQFDEIKIVYTKFINNATFRPTTLRLFPIIKEEPKSKEKVAVNFDFDPDAETIFEKTINLYINTIIYGTIIESQVSEHASRRVAMESATKNGQELIDDLKIRYNRERQAAITQEISEIVGGVNALNK